MKHSPVLEFISAEPLIHANQADHYKVLEKSDKAGDSTVFLEFSLEVIYSPLQEIKSSQRPQKPTTLDRVSFAINKFGESSFGRKQYLEHFPEIPSATASRDLAFAVKKEIFKVSGEKTRATYQVI